MIVVFLGFERWSRLFKVEIESWSFIVDSINVLFIWFPWFVRGLIPLTNILVYFMNFIWQEIIVWCVCLRLLIFDMPLIVYFMDFWYATYSMEKGHFPPIFYMNKIHRFNLFHIIHGIYTFWSLIGTKRMKMHYCPNTNSIVWIQYLSTFSFSMLAIETNTY